MFPSTKRRDPPALRPWLVLALAVLAAPTSAAPPPSVASLLREGRTGEAAERLRGLARTAPFDPHAWVDLGDVERLRCDLEAARAAHERALSLDPESAAARAGLAEVLRLEGRPDAALAEADHGLGLARSAGARRLPGEAALWREKAFALGDLGRQEEAARAARRALALDPSDARASEALGRALYRSGDMAAAREAYRRAVGLDPLAEEANLRLGNGFGEATASRPWQEGRDAPLFLEALAAFDAGDLRGASERFAFLAWREPEAWKYRLGLGLARVALRRRGEVAFGGDPTEAYRRLPVPALPRAGEVVKGLEALAAPERHAVEVAIAPARPFWDALVRAGATHEVFGLADDLTDGPTRAEMRGRSTFDGRPYEHLRGVGGLAAATGAEKLREAAEFGFHTFAHEFAHQVMDYAMPDDLLRRIARLYEAALAEGRCLDWYAASNAQEYFAQGYEAFVSPAKRGCLKDTERHTRAELAERDPALHAFLLAHLDVSHETDDHPHGVGPSSSR